MLHGFGFVTRFYYFITGIGISMASAAKGTDGRYHCTLCSKAYRYKCDLTKHLNIVHSPEVVSLICDVCYKVFNNKRSLGDHYRNTHSGKHQCLNCYSFFSSKKGLVWHVKRTCPALFKKD
jgi:hypothetical protein